MLVVKKINNNVALAQDADGNELVIFGKGVGFPQTPYELEDTSKLQRIFRHIDDSVMASIANISDDLIELAIEVIELAGNELNCELNPNAFLTLADHLQFAAERERGGVVLDNPLAHEVAYVYAREYDVAKKALALLREHGYNLSDSEACSIALHIANAEAEGGTFSDNIDNVMRTAGIVDEVIDIVERKLGVTLDRGSYSFSRFVVHIRYLIRRLMSGKPVESQNIALFEQVVADFPEAHECAEAIRKHLRKRYGWECTDEEVLYLMMYINRLLSGF